MIAKKLINRYKELKQQVPDCILVMQVGIFMQVMNDDAHTIAELTGLQLQMGGDVNQPVVVGGFPHSGLNKYVGLLVREGHSVAVALQDEQKERHIREIIRVEIQKL
ncbi:hypothetical protein PN36_17770 [Candidatus Thiomargarita nelsonii]|uniref:DNA mismatch repair protein MutS-like N-terminal domain-containing protein n=1 Tax=Candidatus Thiomargarita nelsonii TaxID=1003181 RepID=A0A0A6RLJ3_9GAMM|nr:hypothetical protein PN36_17770 [Candidatus Thiomargarita nelsonii]